MIALLDDDEHELRPVVLAADGEARAADGSDLGSREMDMGMGMSK